MMQSETTEHGTQGRDGPIGCEGEYFFGHRHVFICVNGILTWPGDSDGWTDRAVTWLNTESASKAEKFEYATGALLRRLRQKQRAEAITRMVDFYARARYEISLIGHSNGCDLIARVLALTPHQIRSAHLFAAATDGEAFHEALDSRKLGRLVLYVSARDQALRLAGVSRTLFGWAGLGYGNLGREVPPSLVSTDAVTVVRRDDFGHSTWFERGDRFESTMRLLIHHEYGPAKTPATAQAGRPASGGEHAASVQSISP